MDKILKRIKSKYMTKAIVNGIYCVLLLTILVLMMYILLATTTEGFNAFVLIFLIIILILLGFGVICIFLNTIDYLKIVIDPTKSKIIKKFKNIDKILEEIYKTIEYQDKKIIISKNYILGLNDVECLVKCDDIINIIKVLHKFNNTKTYYKILLKDKYNNYFDFKYPIKMEKEMDKVILLINSKCKNSKIGY